MEPVVAALMGSSGSGTSTLARRAASILTWPYASFGAYVRGQAARDGLQGTRKELQDLGLSLLEDVDGFCRAVVAQSLWRPGESLIIDGVRHKSVLEALHRIVGYAKVTTIYIHADAKFRKAHLLSRGEIGFDGIDLIDSHKVEWEVVNELPNVAAKRIEVPFYEGPDPDRSEEFLVDTLVEFLLQMSQLPPTQTRITTEFLLRVPQTIRNTLNLKPGDLLEFAENMPFLVAAKIVDQEKMRSVFGRLSKELENVDPAHWIRTLRGGSPDVIDSDENRR